MYCFEWVLHIITAQMMKEVILMKKILCILLILILILPALAAAAPSKPLQAAYDAADALSVDEYSSSIARHAP